MYPADILAGGELDKSASGGCSVFGTIAENAWESICTVYKHLEIDLGVGQGLYGSLGSLGFIPLEGGFRGDYVHIKIDKGNFRFGQELKGALTGTYFGAEIGASSSTFIENGIEDPSDEWIGYNKNQKSYSIFSSSVYVLFLGYTVNISISPEGLWEEVVEIWKGTN